MAAMKDVSKVVDDQMVHMMSGGLIKASAKDLPLGRASSSPIEVINVSSPNVLGG